MADFLMAEVTPISLPSYAANCNPTECADVLHNRAYPLTLADRSLAIKSFFCSLSSGCAGMTFRKTMCITIVLVEHQILNSRCGVYALFARYLSRTQGRLSDCRPNIADARGKRIVIGRCPSVLIYRPKKPPLPDGEAGAVGSVSVGLFTHQPVRLLPQCDHETSELGHERR
jgi:hypothetical protein